jgi:hypothetical protein
MQEIIAFSGEPVTVNAVQNIVEENILDLLSVVVAQSIASAGGCSIEAAGGVFVGENDAICTSVISAEQILTELNAVATAGAMSICFLFGPTSAAL